MPSSDVLFCLYRSVVYLSTVCEDVVGGKKSLIAAIDALFSIPVTGNSNENSKDPLSENAVVRVKPTLLWNILYIQELTMDCVCALCFPFLFFPFSHRLDSL